MPSLLDRDAWWWGVGVVLAAALTSFIVFSPETSLPNAYVEDRVPTSTREMTRVGAILPLSGAASGTHGEGFVEALESAFQERNALQSATSSLVILSVEDSGCTPAGAASATKRLLQERPALLLGGVCPGEFLAYAQVVTTTPTLLFSETVPPRPRGVTTTWFTALLPTSSMRARATVRFGIRTERQRVGIVAEREGRSLQATDAVIGDLRRSGHVLASVMRLPRTQRQFRNQVRLLKNARVQTVYLAASTRAFAVAFLKEFEAQGVQAQVIAEGGWMDEGPESVFEGVTRIDSVFSRTVPIEITANAVADRVDRMLRGQSVTTTPFVVRMYEQGGWDVRDTFDL